MQSSGISVRQHSLPAMEIAHLVTHAFEYKHAHADRIARRPAKDAFAFPCELIGGSKVSFPVRSSFLQNIWHVLILEYLVARSLGLPRGCCCSLHVLAFKLCIAV
jgi:hypothetical protein